MAFYGPEDGATNSTGKSFITGTPMAICADRFWLLDRRCRTTETGSATDRRFWGASRLPAVRWPSGRADVMVLQVDAGSEQAAYVVVGRILDRAPSANAYALGDSCPKVKLLYWNNLISLRASLTGPLNYKF